MTHSLTLDRLEEFDIDACFASNEHRNAINAELCRLQHPVELATGHINPVYEYLDRVIAHERYSKTEKAQLSKFFRQLKERRQYYVGLYLTNKLGRSCHPYWQAAVDMDRLQGRI